jgi:hypothetical protein
MNKRLIGIILVILALIAFIITANLWGDYTLREQAGRINPGYFSSYTDSGYYKINSDTILTSLNQKNVDVFLPLLEDPDSIEPLSGAKFSWSQTDYLKIASALGKLVWDDPMRLEDWNIYWLLFEGDCENGPMGFYSASIVYYKTVGTVSPTFYTTRLVEIIPYLNMVRWGSEATYRIPTFSQWKNVNLSKAIPADEAARIADENGGKEVRLQKDNQYCRIMVISSDDDNNDRWHVSYFTSGPLFEVYVPMNR